MNIPYPYLPEGKTILCVSAGNAFMQEAERMAKNKSTDFYHPTGAVVVKNGVVIGRAANQSRLKNKKLISFHKNYFCVRRMLKIKSGEKYWLCPGCSPCTYHAESGAVRDALKNAHGVQENVQDADVYLWGHWWCCKPCWDAMIARGIKDVYLLEGSERLFK